MHGSLTLPYIQLRGGAPAWVVPFLGELQRSFRTIFLAWARAGALELRQTPVGGTSSDACDGESSAPFVPGVSHPAVGTKSPMPSTTETTYRANCLTVAVVAAITSGCAFPH